MLERDGWVNNGAAFAVACVIAIQYAISCPFGAILATRASRSDLGSILGLFGKPIAAALIASIPSAPIALLSDGGRLNAALCCIAATAVFLPAYAAAIRYLDRELFGHLMLGIRGGWVRIMSRFRPGQSADHG
jgi:hypothetical protein